MTVTLADVLLSSLMFVLVLSIGNTVALSLQPTASHSFSPPCCMGGASRRWQVATLLGRLQAKALVSAFFPCRCWGFGHCPAPRQDRALARWLCATTLLPWLCHPCHPQGTTGFTLTQPCIVNQWTESLLVKVGEVRPRLVPVAYIPRQGSQPCGTARA